ncbi:MAG TPA: hypothetical protein PKE40_03045 [Arachnia sp.]|nr:hypothetical protein [Arachnia sp.]HMT85306.1 hypothetical protein [Arachnia sp.]
MSAPAGGRDGAAFYTGRSFLTPAFKIDLGGRPMAAVAAGEVIDISFTDDLGSIPSFEFTIDDWDPVRLCPKYSSPDPGGSDRPSIRPGTRADLYFGYRDEGELALVMEGEVISISTSFPAASRPVATVRVVDRFQRGLQKVLVETNMDGTDKQIADSLCRQHSNPSLVPVWAPIEEEGTPQKKVQIDGVLYDEIAQRADRYGLKMATRYVVGRDAELHLFRPGADSDPPVAHFVWGKTLVSFTPSMSAAAAVERVICRGADPTAKGAARAISVSRTWSDIGLDEAALGGPGEGIDEALSGMSEVIKPDDVRTEADAIRAADEHLRTLADELITGEGVSIGLPELRAGRLVTIEGLGARFTGDYRLTKTVHSFGASGYITRFSVRKKVLK